MQRLELDLFGEPITDTDPVDTGVLDADGNRIFRVKRQAGFETPLRTSQNRHEIMLKNGSEDKDD